MKEIDPTIKIKREKSEFKLKTVQLHSQIVETEIVSDLTHLGNPSDFKESINILDKKK